MSKILGLSDFKLLLCSAHDLPNFSSQGMKRRLKYVNHAPSPPGPTLPLFLAVMRSHCFWLQSQQEAYSALVGATREGHVAVLLKGTLRLFLHSVSSPAPQERERQDCKHP